MAYFDEDGNEVTGLLTEEEAKALVQTETKTLMETAAKEKVEAETRAAEAAKAAEDLKTQLEAAKAAPAGGTGQQSQSDKDENVANLRKKLEEAEAVRIAEKTALEARITAIEGDKVQQAINAVAAGNADLAAKIRHNYDKVLSGVQATTAEEISAKIQNAVKLSIGGVAPSPLDTVIPGGAPAGMGGAGKSGQKVEFTQNEAAIGSKLGISDADRAKYGNDPRLTNMNTK
jgi:hypothetical protein